MRASTSRRPYTRQSKLKNWKEYKDFYKTLGPKNFISIEDAKLNRFEARFNLTSRFKGINVDQIKPSTVKGYSAGIHLMLAYTTAELLCAAIGTNIFKWKIEDRKLADDLREMLKSFSKVDQSEAPPLKDLAKLTTNKQALEEFNIFIKNRKIINVRVVAQVIRNAIAHGPFSPYAFDIKNSTHIRAINRLSKKLLMHCQKEFNEWFKEKKHESIHLK